MSTSNTNLLKLIGTWLTPLLLSVIGFLIKGRLDDIMDGIKQQRADHAQMLVNSEQINNITKSYYEFKGEQGNKNKETDADLLSTNKRIDDLELKTK